MALPSSGPLKLSDIRAELGMSSTSNFSLINASARASGYPPILNPYSPVPPPNNISPYSISEWYGYSSATINWYNNFTSPVGISRLIIWVNGTLVLDNTNTFGTGTSGTLVINNGDTFYASMTPIWYSSPSLIACINTFRLTSPYLAGNFTLLNQTTNASFNSKYTPFFNPSQTATILPTDLAVFAINAYC